MTGLIHSIQHFSTGDGPGIRTTVFFQGCSLNCKWCHNPETIPLKPVLLYFPAQCIGCGACERACPQSAHSMAEGMHTFQRNICNSCGKCVEECSSGALQMSAHLTTLENVMSDILSDLDFYIESGGGVTLSGGEPLLQPEFAAAIAKECKDNGIPVIIDTSGAVPREALNAVLPYAETFFFDIKAANAENFKKFTGGNFEKVLSNLHFLSGSGAKIVARIPVIPENNFSDKAAQKMAQLLINANVKEAWLLPFHKLGSGKYSALNQQYYYDKFDSLLPQQLLAMQQIFLAAGINCQIEK